MALLPLAEAQARLISFAKPLPVERIPVSEALGRYLAEPVVANRTQPPADLSAMDGYALRQADLPGPWHVIGESSCGHPFDRTCQAGEAVRIATGALMPVGTDMVLMQEDASSDGDVLEFAGSMPEPLDRHVRRRGNDFAMGAELLPAGIRLGPAQLGLVLSAGHNLVAVRRLPRIVVIDSGDELAADPTTCETHQIPASNGVVLEAMMRQALPSFVERIGPVADNLDALVQALNAAKHADVIVTSGGASVGDHDLLRPALANWGASLDFWKVAVKPGKPVMIATRADQVVVGLPGNPVSSSVTAFLFVLPLLRALSGSTQPFPRPIQAIAAEPLPAGGSRQEFLRATFDGLRATARLNQDSGALGSLARANALIERPVDAPAAAAGDVISLYLLENGGIA